MKAVILLLLPLLANVSSELYHITPSPHVPCPSHESVPCLTRSQFLNTSNTYISSNTSLIFLLGNHTLDAELVVDNVSAFSMLSDSVSLSSTVWIICHYFGTFKLGNIGNVHINGLMFYGCTANRLTSVNYFFLEYSNFIGRDGHEGTALELFKTTARLVRTSFRFIVVNKLYTIECPELLLQWHDEVQQAGGAVVSIKSNVTILHSIFEGNSVVSGLGGAIFHCEIRELFVPPDQEHTYYCESGVEKPKFISAAREIVLEELVSSPGYHINIYNSL